MKNATLTTLIPILLINGGWKGSFIFDVKDTTAKFIDAKFEGYWRLNEYLFSKN